MSRERVPAPTGEPVFRGGENWAAWREQAEWVFCAGFTQRPRPRFVCRTDFCLTRAELAVDPEGDRTPPAEGWEAPLRYPLDQILSWGMLGFCGGVLLHAAAAVRDGEGWVFAGHSGAGKSTIAGFCHAAGWEILNDDRVMVYPRNGRTWVAGTPWHGTGRFAEQREVPLRGLVVLKQDAVNQISVLEVQPMLRSLLDVAAVPWFDEEWSQRTSRALERLAREVPCGRLHFTRSPAALDVLTSL